jgi:Outer membrane protein beta-barrel domain
MRRQCITLAAILLLITTGAVAQENRSEISLQGNGFFTRDVSGRNLDTGQSVSQRATESGGFLVRYKYHINRWLSTDANYGFSRSSQVFTAPLGTSRLQSNVHQVTMGVVISIPHTVGPRISPYVLAEGGALIFDPTSNGIGIPGAGTQAKGLFVYGGGVDFPIVKHVSLRTELRALLYHAPSFGVANLATGAFTQSLQPSVGLSFRF